MIDAMASAGVAAPMNSVTSAPDPAPISIWSERGAPDAAPAMSGKGRSASWVTVGANRPKQNTMTATQGMIVARRTDPPQATARAQPAPRAMSPSAASADMLVERFQALASEVLVHPVHELVGR